jgi:sialic acid synthase SpsE
MAESALGSAELSSSDAEQACRVFRRSLYAVKDIAAGERLTEENVRSIRPGWGLAPKHFSQVLGRLAARNIARGTALQWEDCC